MAHFSQEKDQLERLHSFVDEQKHRISQAISSGADPIDIARAPHQYVSPNFEFYYGVISRRLRHESLRNVHSLESVDDSRLRTLASLGAFAQQYAEDAIILPFPSTGIVSVDQYVEPIAMGN
jgi:hypothetical protein